MIRDERDRRDFAACERIIQEHSKTFYRAFSRLPEPRNQAVYAIYAFCRMADDYVDEGQGRIETLRADLDSFVAGETPDTFMWRALQRVFETFAMDAAPFYMQLDGQAMDMVFQQPADDAALLHYCDHVAGCVGLMLLPLLTDQVAEATPYAMKLGQAMQITNILRDVGEDARRGRVYLPISALEAYSVAPESLVGGTPSDAFIQLWEHYAKMAERLYEESRPIVPLLDEGCKEPLVGAMVLYRAILGEVRAHGYTCLDQKHYVSKAKKAALYLTEIRPMLKGDT